MKNFGRDYDLSATLETNVYLDVAFNYSVDCGYVATDNGDGTATITGYDAETAYVAGDGLKMVVIPENVTVNGKSLKATKIAANAFANRADLGYVLLSSAMKEIGEKAFYNCAALKVADLSACKLERSARARLEGPPFPPLLLRFPN